MPPHDPQHNASASPLHKPMRTGTGRRTRLSDAQTERRMLDAGVRFVTANGLSLSLEHLSMEDLIRDAGVSRTSSYRRWPTKDQFAASLLMEIARATELTSDTEALLEALADADIAAIDVSTPAGRRTALVEALRALMHTDLVTMLDSPRWRSYMVLRAGHIGLADTELRTRVAEALTATEQRFTATRARAFAALCRIIGYHLDEPETMTWEQLSLTVGAMATGMLIRGYSDPTPIRTVTPRRALGSQVASPWSAAALGAVGTFMDAVEPDPEVTWDAEHLAQLRAQLADLPAIALQILTEE
ncbi:TetR/AcrR family transcriptional regulator [Acidipropionibacterium acidipropionici]|nr:hypothetical protein [Acidipropionibacterium acidipropionici]ALN14251.1 hypothetical protein ASQ49_02090 [Acidipropionibacterium acidipropionici]APZ09991.1 hypothetical protein BWX38_12865 [Acidipropionibacterium acidipropionici]MDN6556655.1 hypothetical protein [Acidipropionibacterium acidipropionici]